jgi:hypothetical protein
MHGEYILFGIVLTDQGHTLIRSTIKLRKIRARINATEIETGPWKYDTE